MSKYSDESLQNALKFCEKGSVRAAAKKFGIPQSTLQGKIERKDYTMKGVGRQKLITDAEEVSIVNWLLKRSRLGKNF